MTFAGQKVLRTMRDAGVRAHPAPVAGYYSKHEAGDVMSRITNDADTIQQAIGFPLIGVVSGALLIVWIAFSMLSQSVVLALVALAVTPAMFVATAVALGSGAHGLPSGPPARRRRQRQSAGEPVGGS